MKNINLSRRKISNGNQWEKPLVNPARQILSDLIIAEKNPAVNPPLRGNPAGNPFRFFTVSEARNPHHMCFPRIRHRQAAESGASSCSAFSV